MYEGTGLIVFRLRAIERFRRHIEQWLGSTQQRLHGEGPIPIVSARTVAAATSTQEQQTADVIALPVQRIAASA
jgi:hypothetical protein